MLGNITKEKKYASNLEVEKENRNIKTQLVLGLGKMETLCKADHLHE